MLGGTIMMYLHRIQVRTSALGEEWMYSQTYSVLRYKLQSGSVKVSWKPRILRGNLPCLLFISCRYRLLKSAKRLMLADNAILRSRKTPNNTASDFLWSNGIDPFNNGPESAS